MTGEIHSGSHKSLTCILLLRHQQANVWIFFFYECFKTARVEAFASAEAGLLCGHSTGTVKTRFLFLLVH